MQRLLMMVLASAGGEEVWCSVAGCWPRVWLLGAQKSASVSLYRFLNQVLGICGADIQGVNAGKANFYHKETHFWQRDDTSADAFTALYPFRDDCRRGYLEASPANLRTWDVPPRLRAAVPAGLASSLRFVAVLREPVSRDLSLYNQKLAERRTTVGSYEAYVRHNLETFNHSRPRDSLLWHGIYAPQLERWLQSFSRSQILLFEFADLVANFTTRARAIASFLHLPPPQSGMAVLPHANTHTNPRKQTVIACDVRDVLSDFYSPSNVLLYLILADHKAKGLSPPVEPPFPAFNPTPCFGS